jgi:hypothetical protein
VPEVAGAPILVQAGSGELWAVAANGEGKLMAAPWSTGQPSPPRPLLAVISTSSALAML